MKEARIRYDEFEGQEYCIIETLDNDNTWNIMVEYLFYHNDYLPHTILNTIFSLLIQGYTIIDER